MGGGANFFLFFLPLPLPLAHFSPYRLLLREIFPPPKPSQLPNTRWRPKYENVHSRVQNTPVLQASYHAVLKTCLFFINALYLSLLLRRQLIISSGVGYTI